MDTPANQPRFVTCACEHCEGGIEFDVNQMAGDATRTIECPHCYRETIIFIPEHEEAPPVISQAQLQNESIQSKMPSGYDDEIIRFYDQGHTCLKQHKYKEAIKWLTMAAEQGHAVAQGQLGVCYLNGYGVAKDEGEGIRWLRKAAEQGDALAEYNMGVVYCGGFGVAKDLSDALKWWRKAAEHGDATSQFNLSVCYGKGEGVTQDFIEAYKWAKLAAAQNCEGAQEYCDSLVSKMSKDQIAALNPIEVVNPTEYLRWKREQLIPKSFSDFVGQKRIKARLEVAVAAAKQRKESLSHVLLAGPLGLGKATLANILAKEMGVSLKSTTGYSIVKSGDLAGLLTNLEEGDVLFIDEIHRLPKKCEEYLCLAIKDFKLDIVIDQGTDARSVRLNLPRFTLIGATAAKERLTSALLSCFPIIEILERYSIEELATFARRFANSLRMEIDEGAANRIAQSANGTPLDTLNRLQHVQDFIALYSDYAHIKSDEPLTADVVEKALKILPQTTDKSATNEARQTIPSEVRREVWRRDGGKCVKCGSREKLEYDHIIPVSKGGSNTARNIELLCENCNRMKRDSIQ
jgi:Holliday junction DNA helicase RuvB subunit